jgi:DNA mismatch repair ATPase MutS
MKAFLMFRDHDFEERQPGPGQQELIQDLELNTLFEVMARGDKFLFGVARSALLSSVTDLNTIRYRQSVLRDCLINSSVVRKIYELAVEAIAREKKGFWPFSPKYPRWILSRSVDVLAMFVEVLRKLRQIADESAPTFESEGFTRLFAMLKTELPDEYLVTLEDHLRQLALRDGVLISADLGQGNKGANYLLRKKQVTSKGWIQWTFARRPVEYTLQLHPRDQSGHEALGELRDLGINVVANALAQSTDHILGFFSMLRNELGFYVGCLNLREQLDEQGEQICFPVPTAPGERRHAFGGLYDICLALTLRRPVVANDLSLNGKGLVFITGANRGGKSTFLRSIGLAQVMMQCGMFVPAESFSANVCKAVFTHYKREEDVTMKSGKLDEELKRMSDIVERLTPDSMLLFNESFAATNEREGSEIARQIVSALLEKRIKVFFVTHLYEFARGFCDKRGGKAFFLRAERQADGTRSFRILEGEPLQTSYGQDLYDKIFCSHPRITPSS